MKKTFVNKIAQLTLALALTIGCSLGAQAASMDDVIFGKSANDVVVQSQTASFAGFIDLLPDYNLVADSKVEPFMGSEIDLVKYAFVYDMLFDVANIVLKKHPDWQWDLYGNGETFEEIKQKIEKHKLKGRLNQMGLVNDIYERYKDYAIYVLPSYREGLPLVLLEAKANRLPVVSFDCVTGPREIITDGVDGFLIDCYNKQTMANKILDLIESNDLRIKMSKNSYINLDKFSKEKILNQWIELIEGI